MSVLTGTALCFWAGLGWAGLGRVRSGIVLGTGVMLVLWAIASGSDCRTEVIWRGGKRQVCRAFSFVLLFFYDLSRANGPALSHNRAVIEHLVWDSRAKKTVRS